MSKIFVILFLACLLTEAGAQTIKSDTQVPDSIMEKRHNPTKATLMSTALPGLGQIYNKKYWKVPIIYAGFGVLTYFIVTNAQEYTMYKGAYIEKANNITDGKYPDLVSKYTESDLLNAREYYRRNLEISCLITVVWYGLNILDATVDAHLFTYNISKDLSLKLEPVIYEPINFDKRSSGIKVSLKF